MIQQLDSEWITASEVAVMCKSPPTVETVHNWSVKGIKIDDGIVKLPRVREGGRYLFRRSDVEEFLRRLN